MHRPTTAGPFSGASVREGFRALRHSPISKIFSPVAVLAVSLLLAGTASESVIEGQWRRRPL
eukprot:8318938-Pyramimonas_sp.AAC.1